MRKDAAKYFWVLPSLITSAILLTIEGIIRLGNRLTYGPEVSTMNDWDTPIRRLAEVPPGLPDAPGETPPAVLPIPPKSYGWMVWRTVTVLVGLGLFAAMLVINEKKPTADELYGCTVEQQAPNGECK